MNITLDNAFPILVSAALAVLLLPLSPRVKEAAGWIVGGALVLYAVLLAVKALSVSA